MATPAPAVAGLDEGIHDLQLPSFWTAQPLADDGDSSLGEDTATSTASISSSILHYRTIIGRTYHSDRGNNIYWGANDDIQNNAVDIFYHATTMALDDKLYLAPLPKNIGKVIDIGTGTGLWAIDFADQHPEAEVIGTDLSPIQPAWVPPNVTFEIDDFTLPWTFDDETIGYVHSRWLVGAVPDWTELFKEAYRVLKPGGWIEAYEFDANIASDDGTVTETTASGQWGSFFRKGSEKLGSRAPLFPVSERLLGRALETAGFVDIKETFFSVPTSEWPLDPRQRVIGQFSRATFMDVEGLMGYMATSLGWTEEEIGIYAAHLRRELRELKVHGCYRATVIYAQKPLT